MGFNSGFKGLNPNSMDYRLLFARKQNVLTWILSHGTTDPLRLLIIPEFTSTLPPTHIHRPCGVQPQARYYRILCWLTIYSRAMKGKNLEELYSKLSKSR